MRRARDAGFDLHLSNPVDLRRLLRNLGDKPAGCRHLVYGYGSSLCYFDCAQPEGTSGSLARPKHMNSAGPTYIDRHFTAVELLADHRERLALEEEERARKRTSQFEELRSEVNSVPVRIRAWEKMHGLRLPSDPAHPILRVIASTTGISLSCLREEQRARRVEQMTPSLGKSEDTNA